MKNACSGIEKKVAGQAVDALCIGSRQTQRTAGLTAR
jgi:hypothetical protein